MVVSVDESRLEEMTDTRSCAALELAVREQLEQRDDAEPLDILKRELTNMKLGIGSGWLKTKQAVLVEDASWERVQNVRDALVAEIEVKKKQKPGPHEAEDDTPLGFHNLKNRVDSPTSELKGSEDFPIPITNSLDFSSKAESKRIAIQERRARSLSQSGKKPPLPRRTQFSLPLPSPPPRRGRANGTVSNPSSLQPPTSALKNVQKSTPIKPIVIEAHDPVPGQYGVPIFVDDGRFGRPVVPNTSVPNYTHHSRGPTIDDLLEKKEPLADPNFVPSIPVKSAYALKPTNSEPHWPEELSVASGSDTFTMTNSLTKIYSKDESGSIAVVDLSHMDADELEAEYARLVSGKELIQKITCSTVELTERDSANDEGTVFPCWSILSKDVGLSREDEAEERVGGNIMTKTKPLDELRKRSMVVCEVSSSEPDRQSSDDLKHLGSGHLEQVEEASDDDGSDRVAESRDEVPEASQRQHQEPPEPLRQYFSLSSVGSGDHSSYSDDETYASTEEEDNETEDSFSAKLSPSIEHEPNSFVSEKRARKSRKKRQYAAIERVAAEYFGGKRGNRLTGSGTAHIDRQESVFPSGGSGGCCMAFH